MAHRIYTEPPFGLPWGWVVSIERVIPCPWELQFEGYDVTVTYAPEGRGSYARVVRYATGDPYVCLTCRAGQEDRVFQLCDHIEVVYAMRHVVVVARQVPWPDGYDLYDTPFTYPSSRTDPSGSRSS